MKSYSTNQWNHLLEKEEKHKYGILFTKFTKHVLSVPQANRCSKIPISKPAFNKKNMGDLSPNPNFGKARKFFNTVEPIQQHAIKASLRMHKR